MPDAEGKRVGGKQSVGRMGGLSPGSCGAVSPQVVISHPTEPSYSANHLSGRYTRLGRWPASIIPHTASLTACTHPCQVFQSLRRACIPYKFPVAKVWVAGQAPTSYRAPLCICSISNSSVLIRGIPSSTPSHHRQPASTGLGAYRVVELQETRVGRQRRARASRGRGEIFTTGASTKTTEGVEPQRRPGISPQPVARSGVWWSSGPPVLFSRPSLF